MTSGVPKTAALPVQRPSAARGLLLATAHAVAVMLPEAKMFRDLIAVVERERQACTAAGPTELNTCGRWRRPRIPTPFTRYEPRNHPSLQGALQAKSRLHQVEAMRSERAWSEGKRTDLALPWD